MLELLNEWADLAGEVWPTRDEQWAESVKDVLLTMLLPTVLLIVARYWPNRLTANPADDNPGEDG